jgi:hypothetical protein
MTLQKLTAGIRAAFLKESAALRFLEAVRLDGENRLKTGTIFAIPLLNSSHALGIEHHSGAIQMASNMTPTKNNSTAWIIQTWVSFIVSVGALTIGIANLPVDNWTKGYMAMGTVFAVGSTMSLAKTTRDIHEERKLNARIDEARVEKLLAEHHPL